MTVTSVIPPGRFGLLDSKNNVATKFSEHTSTKKPNVNGGFFVVEPRVFNYLKNDNTIFEQNDLLVFSGMEDDLVIFEKFLEQ